MSTLQITLLSFLLLIILVAMGVHLGVSLLSCSIVGMILAVGNYDVAVNMVISTAYNSLKDYIFGVTPLFILMGLLANLSGASGSLSDLLPSALSKAERVTGICHRSCKRNLCRCHRCQHSLSGSFYQDCSAADEKAWI